MKEIDIFKKYTPEDIQMMTGFSLKMIISIVKKRSRKKRVSIKERGNTWLIGGGEVKSIIYELEKRI